MRSARALSIAVCSKAVQFAVLSSYLESKPAIATLVSGYNKPSAQQASHSPASIDLQLKQNPQAFIFIHHVVLCGCG